MAAIMSRAHRDKVKHLRFSLAWRACLTAITSRITDSGNNTSVMADDSFRILVAEDNFINATLIGSLLEHWAPGYIGRYGWQAVEAQRQQVSI